MSDVADRISCADLENAVAALSSYISRTRAQQNHDELLGWKEEFVWLIVSSKQMNPTPQKKPRRIPLLYPLLDPRTHPICLITKDPQRQYKDLLESKEIKFISRVIGVSKFKGKFKPFEARRELVRDHSVFLADERVVPMLPSLLGNTFSDAKKQPIPVCLTKPNLKSELEKVLSATHLHQNGGTCTSIKIASTTHNGAQILKNLVHAIPFVVANVYKGWDNVQSLHIKTSQSVSLPIWSCDLIGERWESTREKSPRDGEVSGKRRRTTSSQQEDGSNVRITKQSKVDPLE